MQSAKKNKKVRLKYFDFVRVNLTQVQTQTHTRFSIFDFCIGYTMFNFVRVNLTTQRELNTFDCCIWYTMFDNIDTELNTFDFCIEYTMFDPYFE